MVSLLIRILLHAAERECPAREGLSGPDSYIKPVCVLSHFSLVGL